MRDIVVQGKTVLVRVDFNLPQDLKTGQISDDTRIRASLPTINYLLDQKSKIVLCSHWGRPDGKIVESLRMAPVAKRLSELTRRTVVIAPDCVGPEVEKIVASFFKLQPAQIARLREVLQPAR